jgi:uroporphyrinogen-III synthase
MTAPVVTIRPEPGCGATVAAGSSAGLAMIGCPLIEIEPVSWSVPPGPFDGLLLGSANAVVHGGPLVDNLVDKPVYAVGEVTAEAARRHGFAVVRVGRRGLQELVDSLAGERLRLLRLAGRERVPLSPPDGIAVETAVVYQSTALPLPESLAERLREGALVLLHSAAAARHFAAECDRLVVHRGDIRLAALSPRIAEAAGGGWAALRSAAAPNEAALLALAREMCHNPPPG